MIYRLSEGRQQGGIQLLLTGAGIGPQDPSANEDAMGCMVPEVK